jgi:DegV family protein with EDD domain
MTQQLGMPQGPVPASGVAIVTDSAATLPPELAQGNRVSVVPMEVTIGGRSNGDRVVPLDEVLRHLDDGVRTSSPSPGRFSSAIAGAQRGAGVLVLTVARSMSSTYQAARLAARRAPGPVEVLDTGTAAGAEGLVVLAAAQAAAASRPLAEVLETARRAAAGVQLVATLHDLGHLVRGGRLPKTAGWLGRLIGVQPLFEFREGVIHPLFPAFSRRGARRRILARWRRSRPADPRARLHVAALHAMARDEARWLLDAVRAEAEPATAFVGEFDAVMVAHTGPRLTGLAWWWELDG